MEGLDVMKELMERRKVELQEEEEAAEAKQLADREVSQTPNFHHQLVNLFAVRLTELQRIRQPLAFMLEGSD